MYVNLYVMRVPVYLHGIDLRTERRDGVHCILDELPIEIVGVAVRFALFYCLLQKVVAAILWV